MLALEQNEQLKSIRDSIDRICARYDDEYWRSIDGRGVFPEEFVKDVAAGGWFGIAMPEEVGGAGLGLTEASVMMQAIAESGAGFSGASAVHLNIFGVMPLARYGNETQRREHLPRIISGEDRACFGVTEPDSGLDTSSLKTRAERNGSGWIVNGRKIWTTTAQSANKILIIVRTTPQDQCTKPYHGLSLFYTDLDPRYCDVQAIPKMGRAGVDSNMVFIDGLPVKDEELVGEEGAGFKYLLHGLNPERVLFAAEAVGLGRAALRKATAYAREREIFGRPIGQNQGIQQPLAKAWASLEAANLMAFDGAARFDAGEECGAQANAAKYLGAEAGFEACEAAVLTHGGMGYAKEYDVERYFREAMLARLIPVSREMILNYISERVLGLPKSY